MRRKDREITELNDILAIMKKCQVVTLSMVDNGMPYAVTVNFGLIEKDGKVEICFHSAGEGKKMDIIKSNPNVAFAMTASYEAVGTGIACKWTAHYESVYGIGKAEIVSDENKAEYFDSIMARVGFEGKPEYDAQTLSRTAMVKIVVDSLTAKASK